MTLTSRDIFLFFIVFALIAATGFTQSWNVALGIVNMGLIIAGPMLVPPPAGVDVSSAESIAASIHLFEPQHFLFPRRKRNVWSLPLSGERPVRAFT